MNEEQNKRLDEIADQIRILALEVQLLCERMDAAEKQEQQYKKAIESL
jgi:DNA anti-recombination protein RmuC